MLDELCFKCGWLHEEGRGRKCFADQRAVFVLVDGTVVSRPMCRQCRESWHLRAQNPELGRMLTRAEERELREKA